MNLQTNTPHLFGRELPDSIINLIFEFDNTKREAFDRCMNQFSKGCYDRRVPAKHYVKSKYNYWSRGQYRGGRTTSVPEYDENFDEERMARWVDNLYKGSWGDRAEVHMDGRYIKPTNVSSALPVVANFRELIRRRALWPVNFDTFEFNPEFKIAPGDDRWTRDVYAYTYRANQRDWRGTIGQGWRARRVAKGLPIYADKARYNMYTCSRYCTYKYIKLVSKILKNIKKWEKFNPKLCDY
jgi:hypothetical protein